MTMEHISDIIKRISLDIEKEYFEKDLVLDDTMSTFKVLYKLKKDIPDLENTINVLEDLIRSKYHNKLHEEGIKKACINEKINKILMNTDSSLISDNKR